MSINNSRDFLDYIKSDWGLTVHEYLLFGSNVQLVPGSYGFDWEAAEADSVTFKGTSGNDALFSGGGEIFSFFLGSRGDDIYGANFTSADYGEEDNYSLPTPYVDYSAAPRGVVVDMTFHGSRAFTDANGDRQTVSVVGKALDGFGGTDYFAESKAFNSAGYSSVWGVFGTSHRDVMIGAAEFYGGGGDDLLVGNYAHGGTGNDKLIGKSYDGSSVVLFGDEGNDWIVGTDGPGRTDVYLVGGAGNDRVFAGAGDDRYLTGNEGNDFIDAGAGDDFMDGGVGADVLTSGSGNDWINPDVEFFAAGQARDGARDVILVTRQDLGDYFDIVQPRGFEEDRDQIRFADAVCRGADFRVYHEAQSTNPDTGRLFAGSDNAALTNTVLQIDQDGDGFGDGTPDANDYFMVVVDADLSQHGYMLT